MATIPAVYDNILHKVTWETIAHGDTINAFDATNYVVESVQITGTFGGGTVSWTGSNDGTNYVALNNLAGSTAATSSAALIGIQTQTQLVKPAIAGGTGGDVDVTAFLSKRI